MCLRIHLHPRCRLIQLHIRLVNLARIRHRHRLMLQINGLRRPRLQRRLRDKRQRRRRDRPPITAKHPYCYNRCSLCDAYLGKARKS